MELFKAVNCWAKEECNRQQLEAYGKVRRQVLGQGKIVKNMRFPIMKQKEFQDVVLPSEILTRTEAKNIMKYFNCTLTSPVGFLDVHRGGFLLRCCRFKSFSLHGSLIENDPEEEDSFSLTVDKDIVLHGVSLLGNDGGKFKVPINILATDNDNDDGNKYEEILLLSKTGIFKSKQRQCYSGCYFGFDVIFDKPIAVKKDVVYFVDSFVDGPDYFLAHEGMNVVNFSGGKFAFKHESLANDTVHGLVNRGLCAELLFQI